MPLPIVGIRSVRQAPGQQGEVKKLGRIAGARRDGFTLLELLMVLAVLGIVAAILFPVFAQARERGRRTQCLSQIRQISAAHRLYLEDWEERFPDWRMRVSPRPEAPTQYRFWVDCLEPYLRSPATFSDPSFAGPTLTPAEGFNLADYALMTWGPNGSGRRDDPYWRWAGPPLAVPNIPRPAETIALMDGYTTTTTSRGFERATTRESTPPSSTATPGGCRSGSCIE